MRSLLTLLSCLFLLSSLHSADAASEHTKNLLASVRAVSNQWLDLIKGNKRTLDDDDSWPVGTKVYWEFEDGWYEGTITDYDENGYTITWEDESIDYDDFSDETVDEMVANYQTMVANGGDGTQGGDGSPTPAPTEDDSWEIGTKVYWEFDDGWYEGEITDYDDLGYTITWEDDSIDVDDFSDDDVDEMVANYQRYIVNGEPLPTPAPADASAPTLAPVDDTATAADPTPAPSEDPGWPVGTKVYYEFDDGWYEGEITESDDIYVITWEDGSIDSDEYEDEVVDQMVQDYQDMVVNGDGGDDGDDGYGDDDDDSWPVGTKVYGEFEDGWYTGTITDWDDDGYTIEWDDGSIDYDDFSDEDVDQMVENYKTMVVNAPDGGGAGSGGGGGLAPGAILVIVAVVIFAFVGVWYWLRRRSHSREEMEAISPTNSNMQHHVSTPEMTIS